MHLHAPLETSSSEWDPRAHSLGPVIRPLLSSSISASPHPLWTRLFYFLSAFAFWCQLGLVNGDRIRRSECKRRDVGLFIDSNCRTSYLLCPLQSCLPQMLARFAACFLQILTRAFFFMRPLLAYLKLPPSPSSIRPRSCFIFLHSNSHQLKLFSSPVSPV